MIFKNDIKREYLETLFPGLGEKYTKIHFKGSLSIYKTIEDSILKDSRFHGCNYKFVHLHFPGFKNWNWN